jgi:hypothetical protein
MIRISSCKFVMKNYPARVGKGSQMNYSWSDFPEVWASSLEGLLEVRIGSKLIRGLFVKRGYKGVDKTNMYLAF